MGRLESEVKSCVVGEWSGMTTVHAAMAAGGMRAEKAGVYQ